MDKYLEVESSQRQWNETLLQQERLGLIVEEREYLLFKSLSPKVSKDGDQYCVLYGDDLQTGIAGFGVTIYAAIIDFNKQFVTPVK